MNYTTITNPNDTNTLNKQLDKVKNELQAMSLERIVMSVHTKSIINSTKRLSIQMKKKSSENLCYIDKNILYILYIIYIIYYILCILYIIYNIFYIIYIIYYIYSI